ncbi:MAG TPA: fatty acid desaturase [Acidimicrobiales bacterium]|jgi:fatty acid desaturase|nr:fatty acid desaturase [Acidimicrobiales bacterium]
MGISRDLVELVAQEDLARPSAAESNIRTAAMVGAYAAVLATAHAVDRPAVWALAWAAMGALMLGCYAAMHEAIHAHLYAGRRANRIAGLLWGAAVLSNFSVYRAYHLQHHSHTRIEGDPEPHEEFTGPAQYLLYAPVIGLLFWFQLAAASVAGLAGRSPWYARTARQRRAIRVDAAVVQTLTALVAAALWRWPAAVAASWGVPFLVSTTVVSIVTLAEHYGCDKTADPFRATRTTLSNPVVRFLFWNNNFHAAHHIYPAVPYNKVGRLHELTVGRTAYVDRSYTSFHLSLVRSLARKPKPTARAEPSRP